MKKLYCVLFSDGEILMCIRQCHLRRHIKTKQRIDRGVRCVRFFKRYEEA